MVRRTVKIPSVYPAALGAALFFYVPVYSGLSARHGFLAAFGLLCILSAASAVFPVLSGKHGKYGICVFIIAFALGGFAGYLSSVRMNIGDEPPSSLISLERVSVLRGTLLEDPSPYGPRFYRARIRAEWVASSSGESGSATGACVVMIPASLAREASPGSIRVTDGRVVPYAKGLTLELSGKFSAPREGMRDPLIFLVDEKATAPARALSWGTGLSRARATLRLGLARRLYDWGPAGGFLFALISGNRDYLDPGLASDFSRCGLAHVLALSGTHLSLLALVVLKAGRRVAGKRVAVGLSVLAMTVFVWFAGSSPSLNRALIFALLAVSATSLGLEIRMLPILAASSLVQLVLNPRDVASLAFMLSVTALWGILSFGERVRYLAERFVPGGILAEISASIGAQLMTAPVLVAFIGVLAPSGLIASCIVAPLSSVYILAGSALLVASSAIPILSPFFGHCLELLYGPIAGTARIFAQLPVVEPRVLPACIAAGIIPIVAGLAVSVASATSRKRRSLDGAFAGL
jgi:competence protein ComEC